LAVVLIFGGVFIHNARATVSGGSITGNAAADLVVGAANADYNVSFDTNVAATATTITLTFPAGYTITDGSLGTSAVCNSGCGTSGFISVNGVNRSLDSVVGSAAGRTITLTLGIAYDLGTGTGTVFRVVTGITNPTTSGATGTFTIDNDAVGEVEQSGIAAVTLTPDTATVLVVTGQPSGSVSGIALTGQPIVTAQDQYGNTDTNFTETITLTEASDGTLTNATEAAVAGVADFSVGSGLIYTASADQEAFVLTADDDSGVGTDLSSVAANSVTSDVVATKILVTTQPSTIVSGVSMTQPVVKYVDAQDTLDTVARTDIVTVTENGNGSISAGTVAITATSGVAIYTDLVYTALADQEAVTFTFTDDVAANPSNFNAAPVNSDALTADVVATILVYTTQPAASVSGVSMTQPVLEARDAGGLKDTDYITDVVLTVGTGAGSLSGTTTLAPVAGVVTFTNVVYTATADQQAFTIVAASGSITSATSDSVTSDVVATVIALTTAPTDAAATNGDVRNAIVFATQPVVTYRDANGTTDTGIDADIVTVSVTVGAGTLATTLTATATDGVATFADLKYTLDASENDQFAITLSFVDDAIGAVDFSLTPVTDASTVDVVATQLTVATQPGSIVSGVSMTQPIINYKDANSRIDTNIDADVVTVTESGAGDVSGNTTATATDGVATFSGLLYTAAVDQEAVTFTFTDDVASLDLNSSPVNSNEVNADVVATLFTVTLATNTPTPDAADTMTLTAVDADSTTDTGYDPTGLTFAFTDSVAAALSTHTAPDGTAPTIPNSATVIAAFGSGTASLTTFKLVEAEVLGAITVSDGTLSGTSASVTVRNGATSQFAVTVSDDTPTTGTAVDLTVTAQDQFENTASGANGGTAYTGTVFFSTNATAPTWHTPWSSWVTGDAGTKTISSAITFSTAEGSITITAQETDGSPTGTSSSITASASDAVAPTVDSQTPVDAATSVAITTSPTITFSEAMDASTINPGTVQLRAYSDDSVITTTLLYNPSTFVVTLDPVASLSNSTQYYIWASGAKDAAANTMTAYTTKADQEFTTAADSSTLAVTGISTTNSTMTADATYANGGSWTFSITVPTTETELQLKFGDWVSGANSIATASNMRVYSAQASANADADNAVTVTAADTYTTAMTLDADLNATTAGRQVQVVVNLKVPEGTSGGSYSTNYTVQSATP